MVATVVALSSGCSSGPDRRFIGGGSSGVAGATGGTHAMSATGGDDASSAGNDGSLGGSAGRDETESGGDTHTPTGGTGAGPGADAAAGGDDSESGGWDAGTDGGRLIAGGSDAGSGDQTDTGNPGTGPGSGGDGTASGGANGLENGSNCSHDSECRFDRCVDGVCCDSACTGQCESCIETAHEGKCSIVLSGDPRGDRPACSGTDGPCKGHCDGSDADSCRYPNDTVVCTSATCMDGTVTTASVCDSVGTCTAAETSPCASGRCESGGSARCADSCSASSCGTNAYCDARTGACLPLKAKGKPCTDDAECDNDHCVDGFCCESECTGQCQSCSATPGSCTVVTTPRTPCNGSGTCAGRCDGTNGVSCAYAAAETTCGTASCLAGKATPAPVCDGRGACATATATTCPYGCVPGGTTCAPCRQKSSSNILTNPGFDGSLTGWTVVGGAAYQPTSDAEDCTDSGSILLDDLAHEVKQCQPAAPNTLYSFGFRFKGTGPGDLPSAFCAMIFYQGTSCTTSSATSNITYVQPVSDKTTWVQGSGSAISPPDTGSVILNCSGQGGFGYYDQLYVSSTNATF